MKENESEIQTAICDYLAYKGYFFWRQNTGGMYREGRYFKLPKYAMRGVPDIIAIVKGKFVGIEVKRPGAKLSPHQQEFGQRCMDNYGRYIVARSIDEIQSAGL